MHQSLRFLCVLISSLVLSSRAFLSLSTNGVSETGGRTREARGLFDPKRQNFLSGSTLAPSFFAQGSNEKSIYHLPRAGLTNTKLFSAPAVLEPPTKEKEKVEEKKDSEEKQNYSKKGGWAVRLFNDPMNKREFVAMCLSKIVGLSDGQAYQVMMQAHKNGVSVVGRFDFERADHYKTQLVEHGLMCDMIEVED